MNKDICAWTIKKNGGGCFYGPKQDQMYFEQVVFSEGYPLDEILSAKSQQEFESALNKRQHKHFWWRFKRNADGRPERISLLERTENWYHKQFPIPATSDQTKEKLQKYDFLHIMSCIPAVSPRALEVFHAICPDEFEAYDITIQTSTGPLEGYKLLNLTHQIFGAMDLDASVIKSYRSRGGGDSGLPMATEQITNDVLKKKYQEVATGSLSREDLFDITAMSGILKLRLKHDCMKYCHIGRFAERLTDIMVSPILAGHFAKAKLKGFLYESFEDHNNVRYTMNFDKDGNLL